MGTPVYSWKARTEAVPKMNMTMMTGVAMRIDRPMSREGDLASPAMMAMYSSPAAAKRVWPMRARELGSVWGRWSSKGVKWMGTGWAIAQKGARIKRAKAVIIAAPETLWIHLPK